MALEGVAVKEKLQEYALLAEIISAICIVLSLVFVGLQVRLGAEETAANSRALEANVRESMLNADLSLIQNMMDYPSLVKFNFSARFQDFSDVELRSFVHFVSMMRTRENYWVQHENGLLDTATYLSYRTTFINLMDRSDFHLDMWKNNNDELVPGFKAEIDNLLLELGRLP